MIRALVTVVWMALLLACSATVQAQTSPCDGNAPTAFYVVPPAGAAFVFPYSAGDHDTGVTAYKLTLRQAVSNAVRTEQTVPKANVTLVGPTATAGVNCYSLPIVASATLPKGQPLIATLTASSSTAQLSSGEGPPTGPFGAPLGQPAVRPLAAP